MVTGMGGEQEGTIGDGDNVKDDEDWEEGELKPFFA